MVDTCEAHTADLDGNYVNIYAVGYFAQNKVSVSWQYGVCHCPAGYASGYLTGTLKITVDGGSITYIIDCVCSAGRTVTFIGLEESDHYSVAAQIDSLWQCSSPHNTFLRSFNRTIGCIVSI